MTGIAVVAVIASYKSPVETSRPCQILFPDSTELHARIIHSTANFKSSEGETFRCGSRASPGADRLAHYTRYTHAGQDFPLMKLAVLHHFSLQALTFRELFKVHERKTFRKYNEECCRNFEKYENFRKIMQLRMLLNIRNVLWETFSCFPVEKWTYCFL